MRIYNLCDNNSNIKNLKYFNFDALSLRSEFLSHIFALRIFYNQNLFAHY